MSGNQALNTNAQVGQQADLGISTRASDWYFAVCAIMAGSTLVFMGMAFGKRESHRLFHYITASITFVACIAYFSMGAGLGRVPIQVEFPRRNDILGPGGAGTREIFYVRYIDWFITTPLLLLDLLLTAGVPWPTVLVTLLADEIMIVTGLVGALTSTSYKWAYWLFGMFAFFYVVYALVIDGRRHAAALGGNVSTTYRNCGVLTIFLWFLYPIAWGVSEGGNIIHPDSEAVFYGILDVLAKPLFGFLLLWGHRNIDLAALGLHIREPGQPKIRPGQHEGEHGHVGGAGPSNGL
ncbi:FDD123-like protein-2 [Colletotrichum shisoi]|uniref:Opsin-like protein carO n=1 Tax=Colletotrichum shisoi TaxID=2078593 RepID=A0A5Q4BY96_9PEZI|nr:FDD123-like protein-2 [Colletotrichum shisoi]